MEKQLPKNWVETELGEITTKPQYGWTSKAGNAGEIKYLRTTDLSKGKVNWETVPYCIEIPDDVSKYQVEKNDILISRAGSVGFSHRIENAPERAVFASYLIRFKPLIVNPKLIEYYLNSAEYWSSISDVSAGIAVQNINAPKLSGLNFPLPPLPEQNRIVAKLDSLFAQLEMMKTSMAAIPVLLKNFRQQVLTQAVTGKLTASWRVGKELEDMYEFILKLSIQREKDFDNAVLVAKKDKLKKPKKDFEFEFERHPSKLGWCISKLDNLVYMSARIGWKGLKAEEYTQAGPLFISVHSLNYGENVNYEKAYHITNERFLESPEIMLEEDDILLCKDGAGIGKLGIVKNLKEKATVNSSLLVIRGREALNSKFLYYFFLGPALQNIAKERITGTAIPHLFQRDIKEFYVEIPPLEEQQEIVSRVENLFAKADAIEKQYKTLKEKIDNLPQAMLHKAFKGELVEQLDSDGDAKELLKEIQELRAQTAAVGKKKVVKKNVKEYKEGDALRQAQGGNLGMVAEEKK